MRGGRFSGTAPYNRRRLKRHDDGLDPLFRFQRLGTRRLKRRAAKRMTVRANPEPRAWWAK